MGGGGRSLRWRCWSSGRRTAVVKQWRRGRMAVLEEWRMAAWNPRGRGARPCLDAPPRLLRHLVPPRVAAGGRRGVGGAGRPRAMKVPTPSSSTRPLSTVIAARSSLSSSSRRTKRAMCVESNKQVRITTVTGPRCLLFFLRGLVLLV